MKYLIDTHVLIWALTNDEKLTDTAHQIVATKSIYVSNISLWEISIKYQLGKLEWNGFNPADIWQEGEKIEFKLLPFSPMEATGFYKLERLHKDVFDRMIIWQAIKNSMVLVSKDSRMQQYEKFGLDLTWWKKKYPWEK